RRTSPIQPLCELPATPQAPGRSADADASRAILSCFRYALEDGFCDCLGEGSRDGDALAGQEISGLSAFIVAADVDVLDAVLCDLGDADLLSPLVDGNVFDDLFLIPECFQIGVHCTSPPYVFG